MTDRRSPPIEEVRRSLERLGPPRPPGDGSLVPPQPEAPSEGPDKPPVVPPLLRPLAPPAPGTAPPPITGTKGRFAPAGSSPKPPAPRRSTDPKLPAKPAGGEGAVTMDPRIKRRRIDVRRHEGRRRLHVLVGCLAVLGAVGAAFGAGRSPLFDVDYADVRGTEQTPRAEIVEVAGLGGHPAMLDIDTRAVAHQVEALPWVLHATARREWPGTVRIDITERRPAAVLPAGAGAWALADRTGRILRIGPEKPAGLPVVGNLPPPTRAGASVPAAATSSLRVAAALPPTVRERVADIATLATGEVELQLTAPGGVVRLGRPVDLDTKLRVLATVLAHADLARVSVVDVRVPKAPALTRR